MIIVPVKEGESIDRALKRYKLMKAIYVQKLREAEENM